VVLFDQLFAAAKVFCVDTKKSLKQLTGNSTKDDLRQLNNKQLPHCAYIHADI
jgi:hypothetical protein